MNRPPAFQFYPKEWLVFRIQRMSLPAQAVYKNLLCLMWTNDQDQHSWVDDDTLLAKALGLTGEQWMELRQEIQCEPDPLFQQKNGRLQSALLRQQVLKQRKYRKQQAEKGKLSAQQRLNHGSTVVQPQGNSSISSPTLIPIGSQERQKIKTVEVPAPSIGFIKNEKHVFTPEQIRERWNAIEGVRRCKHLDGTLLQRVNLLLREKPETWWAQFFSEVEASNLLRGKIRAHEGQRRFQADLSWTLEADNLGKVMSGNYNSSGDRMEPRRCAL